jgi:hypothetical protein
MNKANKKKVIEWCTHHRDDPMTQDDQERRTTDIDEWDQKYMEVDQETLFDIIMASILTQGRCVYLNCIIGCQLP